MISSASFSNISSTNCFGAAALAFSNTFLSPGNFLSTIFSASSLAASSSPYSTASSAFFPSTLSTTALICLMSFLFFYSSSLLLIVFSPNYPHPPFKFDLGRCHTVPQTYIFIMSRSMTNLLYKYSFQSLYGPGVALCFNFFFGDEKRAMPRLSFF